MDAGVPAPCDVDVLPDGTCQFGMPAVTPENKSALAIYGDIKSLGWEAAVVLNGIAMTDYELGDLLLRLRTICCEVAAIEREKMQAASSRSAGND